MLCHSRLSAVWVLLAAAAAVELYDELTPELDGELVYQDVNDIDTGPPRELHVDNTEATRFKDLLLFRLIKSLQGDLHPEHRTLKDMPGGILGMPTLGSDATILGKRFAQPRGARPQQRWKTKKGKVIGSQMVCYFKLCAFRNPA